MTVETLPWSIQGASHPATVARNATAAIFGAPSAALTNGIQVSTAGGGHGVVNATDFTVSAGGGMNVSVSAGRAVIRGSDTGGAGSLGAGCYTAWNDAAVTLAISAADATNARKDLVVIRCPDSNYTGASNVPLLQVITGTPAGSPADPTVTSNCVVLARVTVPALGATVISGWLTDLRTRACAVGGVQVCTSTTRPTGVSLYQGLKIYETDTYKFLEYQTATTGWTPPWNLPWGTMGYVATNNTDQTGITAAADITGLALPSITFVANRRLRFSWHFLGTQVTSNGDSSSLLNKAGSDIVYGSYQTTVATYNVMHNGLAYDSPAAGAATYKIRATTTAGTLTIKNTVLAGILLCEDIGPSANPA